METVSTFKTGARYGIITGLALVLLGLVYYLTGIQDFSELDTNWPTTIINYVVMAAGIILAQRYFKSQNEDTMSYGQGLGTGMSAALLIGIVSAIWILVFFHLIDPSLVEVIREAATEKALAGGDVTEEELESASGIMNFFTSPTFMAIAAVFATLIFGLIVSLISSAILKSNQ